MVGVLMRERNGVNPVDAGGTGQESYELALYFLALHTEMDCWVKRQKRGYLFMTGDGNPYPILSRHVAEAVTGDIEDEC